MIKRDTSSKRHIRTIIFAPCLIFLLTAFLFVSPARAAASYEVDSASTLDVRITNLQDGDTIKLTADISYGNNYVGPFDGKNVTIDLNGHSLSIGGIWVKSGGSISVINTNYADGNAMTVTSYLTASSGSTISSDGDGVLRVNNGQVTADGIGSSITVNSLTTNSHAAIVKNGGEITVNGDITVNTGGLAYGVYADTGGGTTTVNGDISVTGSGYGVYTKD